MTAPVAESWKRVTAWFQAHTPEDLSLLQGPASPDEFGAAAARFQVAFPDDLAALYGIMNGTNPNGSSVGLFPSAESHDMAFGPLAVSQIVYDWEMLKELLEMGDFADCTPKSAPGVANDWWNLGWIPIATNGGGDYFCVDLAPAAGGTRGQVITHSHESGEHLILAPSLAAYLADLAKALEAGELHYHDTYGIQRH